VWADDRVVVRRSSIEGSGLFAGEDIREGTVVLRLGGRLVTSVQLAELIGKANLDPDASFVDTITILEDAHLVLPPATLAHFGNHSCDPNLWHDIPYELTAARDLLAGEEFTLDYATGSGAEGFTMECNCGSEHCRGRVTSQDWRRPELQHRYQGHWTPALQQRIDHL
jgi:SET domain-containing protein